MRSKDTYDGATPSAHSVAALALLRLGALTGEERYTGAGATVCRLLEPLMERQPLAFTNLLAAVDLLAGGITEVAITGGRADLVSAVQATYLPSAVLAWGEPYPSPLWEGRAGPAPAGRAGARPEAAGAVMGGPNANARADQAVTRARLSLAELRRRRALDQRQRRGAAPVSGWTTSTGSPSTNSRTSGERAVRV